MVVRSQKSQRWLFLAAPLALALAGCAGGVLDPQGPVGAANAKILLDALGAMLLVVIPTIAAALAFAWWFRASNTRARYQPGFVYSGRLELVVWAIPILIVNFLGGVIWFGAHDLDPFRPIAGQKDPLQVQVVALDWKWLFIYPEQGIASVNELTVPAGEPVHFSLTSAAVMNMFFVPQLGTMIAAMPRMATQLHLKADHTGEFYGQSTQFSGDGFSDMHFTLHAVPQDEFARWIKTVEEGGPWLDRAGYMELLRESQNVRPFTYQSVEPGLFDDIVAGLLPFAEGPGSEGGGPPVRPRGAK
ncbi:MAG: ubiquinol oxidase subunit II [Methylocapsa sp.]|nr:ubiquinol oxidase subunit II [Methylocapsa sp.]